MSQVSHSVTDDEPAETTDGPQAVSPSPARRPPSMDDSAWGMFGYVLSGILFWGGIGWLLDNWLDRSPLFVPIGVLAGAALGIYLGWLRFLRS